MIAGLLIGFLLGTRARQVVASAKAISGALKSFSFKIPSLDSALGQAQATDDGADDEKEDGEDESDDLLEIENFILGVDEDATLADHPDVQMSPVILYNIKKAKDQLRVAQRRAALAAEGLDEREVDERMELEQGSGGGGGGRSNPLALLISVGARVEASAGAENADRIAMQERRRLQRNVDAYLSKANGIEKYKGSEKEHRDQTGGRLRAAHEVAFETSSKRFGGQIFHREVANVKFAKEARMQFRKFQAAHAKPVKATRDGISTAGFTRGRAGGGVGGGMIDMDALASLQEEFSETGGGLLGDDDDDELGDDDAGEDDDVDA